MDDWLEVLRIVAILSASPADARCLLGFAVGELVFEPDDDDERDACLIGKGFACDPFLVGQDEGWVVTEPVRPLFELCICAELVIPEERPIDLVPDGELLDFARPSELDPLPNHFLVLQVFGCLVDGSDQAHRSPSSSSGIGMLRLSGVYCRLLS